MTGRAVLGEQVGSVTALGLAAPNAARLGDNRVETGILGEKIPGERGGAIPSAGGRFSSSC